MITRRALSAGVLATMAAAPARSIVCAQTRESALVALLTIAAAGTAGDDLARELDQRGGEKGLRIDLKRLDAGGRVDALPIMAAEAVGLKPRAIITYAADPTRAVQRVTSTIPIVAVGDLLGAGLVESLARPGGNTTGVNLVTGDLDIKKMEVLREILPGSTPLGMLNYGSSREPDKLRQLGDRLRIDVRELNATTTRDFDSVFANFNYQGVRAVVVANASYFAQTRAELLAAAARHRIALVCEWLEMAVAGCLASYGYLRKEFTETAADYVVRILTGAAPGSLPVVEPKRFQLVVNQRVARELGLTISPTVLARADEVLE